MTAGPDLERTIATAVRSRRRRPLVALAVGLAVVVIATTCGGSDRRTGPEQTISKVVVEAPLPCAVSGCVGDGVDTASGAFRTEAEDILFPAGLFGVTLARTYRSDRPDVGWFGRGWASVYETTLKVHDETATINAPAGFEPLWTPVGPAGWSVAGNPTVQRAGQGHDLRWPTGETWRFDPSGHLVTITSPYGATVMITRTADAVMIASQNKTMRLAMSRGRVVSATDGDNRQATYTYAGDQLSDVAAPGITFHYGHDGQGRISTAATPDRKSTRLNSSHIL